MPLVAFALTEFVLSLTPGPAVLLVISQAVTGGFRASARGALGIISGNAFYFGLSALGVGALLVASEPLFQLIRILGALYLVWIGIRLIVGRAHACGDADQRHEPELFRSGAYGRSC